jgi:hypothetical protein
VILPRSGPRATKRGHPEALIIAGAMAGVINNYCPVQELFCHNWGLNLTRGDSLRWSGSVGSGLKQ